MESKTEKGTNKILAAVTMVGASVAFPPAALPCGIAAVGFVVSAFIDFWGKK